MLTTWKTYDGIALTQDLKEIKLGECLVFSDKFLVKDEDQVKTHNSKLKTKNYIGHYFDNKLYLLNKGFTTKNLKKLLEEIDENKNFNPASIIVFGYNFESKVMREIAENVKSYANKKQIDIDFITRY